MAQIINISIDITKLKEAKVTEVTRKDNTIAKFISLDVFVKDEQDQYNNIASVSISQSKAEREAKKEKVYVGNGKRVWSSNGNEKPITNELDSIGSEASDLPF